MSAGLTGEAFWKANVQVYLSIARERALIASYRTEGFKGAAVIEIRLADNQQRLFDTWFACQMWVHGLLDGADLRDPRTSSQSSHSSPSRPLATTVDFNGTVTDASPNWRTVELLTNHHELGGTVDVPKRAGGELDEFVASLQVGDEVIVEVTLRRKPS